MKKKECWQKTAIKGVGKKHCERIIKIITMHVHRCRRVLIYVNHCKTCVKEAAVRWRSIKYKYGVPRREGKKIRRKERLKKGVEVSAVGYTDTIFLLYAMGNRGRKCREHEFFFPFKKRVTKSNICQSVVMWQLLTLKMVIHYGCVASRNLFTRIPKFIFIFFYDFDSYHLQKERVYGLFTNSEIIISLWSEISPGDFS